MKEGARVHHSYGSYAPSTYGSYEPRRAKLKLNRVGAAGPRFLPKFSERKQRWYVVDTRSSNKTWVADEAEARAFRG
jgi:hypothetical protein